VPSCTFLRSCQRKLLISHVASVVDCIPEGAC
jgi:hypothetical protein